MDDHKNSIARPLILAIEGVSLAGKTTLCKRLSACPGTKFVPELSTFYNDGDCFPLIANSDQAARQSDDWFFHAELERQKAWNESIHNTKLVILDRSFVSMIVFSLARKLQYGVGEPWKTARRLFESDLAVSYSTPVHLYLKLSPADYKRRKELATQHRQEADYPVKRVRFDEQHETFIETQIELYDHLFALDEDRILNGVEKTSEIYCRATRLKLGRAKEEHEYLRLKVDGILSRLGLPDTRH